MEHLIELPSKNENSKNKWYNMLFGNCVRITLKLKISCSSSVVSIFDSVERNQMDPLHSPVTKKINTVLSWYKLITETEKKKMR